MSYQIRDISANNVSIRHLMRSQYELFKTQVQVTTGDVSQDYKGISSQSQRLINTENTRTLLEKFQQDNVTTTFRLNGLDTTTDTINGSIKNFYDSLKDFKLTGGNDPARIKDIQTEALKGLEDIQGYLNTQLDGRHIYAGGRASTRPVDFGLTSLANFQTRYDGIGTNYPTTRDAHLDNLNISANPADGAANWLTFAEETAGNGLGRITAPSNAFGNLSVGATIDVTGTAGNNGTYTIAAIDAGGTWMDVQTEMLTTEAATAAPTITNSATPAVAFVAPADFTTVEFTRGTGTITAVPAASLDPAVTGLSVGSTFTVAGSASNNGTFTVVSNDGTNLVVEQRTLTTQGVAEAGTVATASYYSGDQQAASVRVSQTRSVEFDLTAIDPSFEKAIRAMHIVMQGVTGTEGGLDKNTARVDDAIFLLESSLGKNPVGTAPYGTEDTANLDDHLRTIAFNRLVVDRADTSLTSTINYLTAQSDKIEKVDPTATLTKLLNISQSLEASYKSFARVRELSLVNFMS